MEDAGLARTKAIEVNGDVVRRKAPLLDFYALPHTAFLLSILEAYFRSKTKSLLQIYRGKTGWLDTCLWREAEVEKICLLMERTGYNIYRSSNATLDNRTVK